MDVTNVWPLMLYMLVMLKFLMLIMVFFLKLFTQKQKIKREKRGTMPIRYILDLNGGSVEVTITVKEKS